MNTSEPKKTVIISAVLSQAAEVCTVRNSCTANLSMECLNIDPVLRDKTENYAEVWVKEVQARIGKMDVLFIPAVKEACDPLSKAGIEFVSMCSLYSATIPHGKADPHNPWGYVAYYGGSIAMSDSVSMLVEMRQNNVSFSWLDVPGVYFFTNPQGKGAVQITAEILNMTARDMVVFVEDSAKLKGCNLTISIDTFSGLCDPDKLPAKGIKAKANAVANILKGYGGILGSVMYHIATSPDAKLREDMIALLDLPKDMSDDAKLTLRKAVVNEAKLTLRKAVANDAKLTFQAAVAGLPELK